MSDFFDWSNFPLQKEKETYSRINIDIDIRTKRNNPRERKKSERGENSAIFMLKPKTLARALP
jgi:hypothetical protein